MSAPLVGPPARRVAGAARPADPAHTYALPTNTRTQSQFPVKVLRSLGAILYNALVIIIVYPSSNYAIVAVSSY